MAKMKMKFELENPRNIWAGEIEIIGTEPECDPYVSVTINGSYGVIPDKDLERFAVNILKAIGSKKLKIV